ncbi:hypothetical protein [Microbulbifer pacificus]|uniref:Uncharacterized protein n=1 Tax=Microbulbifer pacificus TaxID=407164 RepID=A0AAU0N029_9GAMM|nr:hypothetical protein [Microbulbifer pacificus]WOX06339.1 hypothetical protein R5R33_04210 [Microbulbifer pacificus]
MKKLLRFDPNKSFIELPIVWITVGFISLTSAIFVFLIAKNGHYEPNLNARGFNFFLSEFKFPLGTLALIIPIVALLSANHRSEQTKAQIYATNSQNLFTNYYKHIEEFEKYISKHENLKESIQNPRKLHKKIYPNARFGETHISNEVTNEIEKKSAAIIDTMLQFSTGHRGTQNDSIFDLNAKIDEFANDFHITFNFKNGKIFSHEGMTISLPELDLRYLFIRAQRVAQLIETLLTFDTEFESPIGLRNILNIDIKGVPSYKINDSVNAPPFELPELSKEY